MKIEYRRKKETDLTKRVGNWREFKGGAAAFDIIDFKTMEFRVDGKVYTDWDDELHKVMTWLRLQKR